MERPAHLGCFLWRCECLLVHAVQAVESTEERVFVGAAELQREDRRQGCTRDASQQLADVRVRRGIQDPVRGPGSGGCVCAVRGQHVQVGLVRSSRGAAGAGRRHLRSERVPARPPQRTQGTHR